MIKEKINGIVSLIVYAELEKVANEINRIHFGNKKSINKNADIKDKF